MSGQFVLAPPNQHGNQTILHGKTLPDISLGSMAASFDADAQEELDLQRQNAGEGGDQRDGILRNLDGNSKRATETPQPRRSGTPTGTPPTAYRTAITSYDESASISAQAFSRRRPLPSSATDGSISIDQRKQTGGMYFAFGDASKDNVDEEELLSQSQLLPSTSPVWEGTASRRTAPEGNGRSSRASMAGSMTASRSGRQSVAPGDGRQSQNVNHVQQMTLRDQQQDHEKLRTENFSLRLENASLKELVHKKIDRDKAELFTENASLKATIEALMLSTKQSKKLVIQLQRALEKSAKEHAEMEENLQTVIGENGELYKLRQDIREEEDARIAAENKIRALEDDLDHARHSRSREEAHGEQEDLISDLKERLEDAEEVSQGCRDASDRKDEQLDDLKAELAKLSEDKDRLQHELENMQAGVEQQEQQRELESRLHEQIDSLTSEKASLQREMEALRRTIETRDEEDQDNERLRREIRELESIIGEKNELLEQFAAMEEDFDETRALLQEKQAALEESDTRHGADLSELDNQWRSSLSQAEDKIQVLEEDLAEMEERWRLADQQLAEKAADADVLRDEVEQLDDQIAGLISDKERLIEELQEADREVRESDLTRDAVNGFEDEIKVLRDAEEHALHERDSHRRTVDELSRQLAGVEAERRTEMEQNRKLIAEKTQLVEAARHSEKQHNSDIEQFQHEMEHEVERWKRMIGEKEQSNVRMSQELEAMRDRLAQRDEDVRDLQDALNNLENARRRLGDERSIDQYSSQLEIDRVRRDLASSEDQLNRALEDIQDLEATLSDKQAELADLIAEKRETESRLTAERQDRLTISDKLSEALKIAKQAESDASGYRERIEELERRLSDDRRGLNASVRHTDKSGKEVQDLLRMVYARVSQVLGLDEDAPSTATALREKLSLRLKLLAHLTAEYEKKIRAVEIKLEHGISSLNRELDSKKRLLDNVETSVNKVAHAKQEWRAKLLAKEEELAQAKVYQREAALELASHKATNSVESSSELRSLQVKASSGDKRVNALSNQLNDLHSTIAAQEAKHADATTKWEDRVREYEKRLKAAAEKVKAEKQGGKERVNHLEKTVRELNEQIKALRAKESRLTAIVNAASFTRHDPDAL
ncbi:hypothetical protein QFC21_002384 [Naganishia friedmannii]|uniref:Uncharacterized protein n=1 Tax=Naganishia friedmannii TaxID=89922 RepID=A0ACC2VYQ4_9TREE|nr:hypothetical protein QFC21_002384 [Naganishia friedmannii]